MADSEGIRVGEPNNPGAIDANFRQLRDAIDDLEAVEAQADSMETQVRSRWISAGDMIALGTTAQVYQERWAVQSFPDAVDTNRCAGQTDVPPEWGAGTVAATAYFGTDASSTNPFRMRLVLSGVTPGAALGVSDTSQDVDIAGDATANDLVEHAFATTLTLAATDRVLCARFLRLGAHANDTHAATVHLIGVRLQFTPS